MSQDEQNSNVPPCPVCNAQPEQRVWSSYINYGAMIRSPKHRIGGSQVVPLVCTQCGYVQLFTNVDDFVVFDAYVTYFTFHL